MEASEIDWSDRFWSKVHPEALSGCWLWHGALNEKGYGRFNVRKGRAQGAHRQAWRLVVGPVPTERGVWVLHRCDVRACVNPDHLFLGSHRENMRDMATKGRAMHGSDHVDAVLNETNVLEVRRMLAEGASRGTVARMFGVDRSAIRAIIVGRTWKHVTAEVVS